MSGMVCEEQDENGLRKSSWAQAALARPSPFPGPSAPYLAGVCTVSKRPLHMRKAEAMTSSTSSLRGSPRLVYMQGH